MELRDLDNKDIFQLIQTIVQNIKVENTFDVILSNANTKVERLKQNHNNNIIFQQFFEISDTKITNSQIGTNNSEININTKLSDEISQAILEIKEMAELSEENKSEIIELLKIIYNSLQSDNKEKQTKAKISLKQLLKDIGDTGVKVIDVLSGLASLANFFNFIK